MPEFPARIVSAGRLVRQVGRGLRAVRWRPQSITLGVDPLLVDLQSVSAHEPVPCVVLQRSEKASGTSGPGVAGRDRFDLSWDVLADVILTYSWTPHLPRPRCVVYWFPGREEGSNLVNLLEALRISDSAFPWLTQYRLSSEPHPGTLVPRIQNKFFPSPQV